MDFYKHLTNNFTNEVASEIIKSLALPRTHALLLNTNKLTHQQFLEQFPEVIPHPITKSGYLFDCDKYEFGKHYLHDLGVYYLQEPSAMSVVSLLGINQGDLILDLCAAPGGKTMQASLLLGDSGIIIANDISHSRALVLSQNIERMGLGNIIVTNNDFSSIFQSFENTFDRIILDAPCSGSGMFRKNDKMVDDWSFNKVLSCQKEQQSLLRIAYKMLKPGGTLAYITCSFSKEENEDVIEGLLASSDAFLEPLTYSGLYNSPHLKNANYFLPSRFHGEGHFLAMIKKPGLHTLTIYGKNVNKNNRYELLKKHSLEKRNNLEINGTLYSLPYSFNYKNLNVLRYGVRCYDDVAKNNKPHHHLARFLSSEESLALNYNEFTQYLAGEVIKHESTNGYHIVSFNQINVGWTKASNGTLKNLLPKGLRRR